MGSPGLKTGFHSSEDSVQAPRLHSRCSNSQAAYVSVSLGERGALCAGILVCGDQPLVVEVGAVGRERDHLTSWGMGGIRERAIQRGGSCILAVRRDTDG